MRLVGIDIGSTFLKSSLLDTEAGCVTHLGSAPTPDFLSLTGGRREVCPVELARSVAALIDSALEEHAVEGVLFSVQMHGFMLFQKDGAPATGYATWQDTRASEDGEGESLFENISKTVPKELFAENGILLAPNHSLLPLCHYLREHPEHQNLEFAMIGDAVTRILTGERVPLHPSQAASAGLYSLEKGDWNKELISLLGLGEVDFPAVSEEVCRSALYKGIPIFASVGDHQAAVLGIGAGKGDLFINIATGGQVGYIDETPVIGEFETRPFFEGAAIRTFTDLPSGRDLAVLMEFVKSVGSDIFSAEPGDNAVWAAIDKAAAEVEDSDIAVDLGFFGGKGAIGAIGSGNLTVGSLFVAAWKAMAAACSARSRELLGEVRPCRLICTGGVLRRNPRLVHMVEEALGLPALLPASADDTMQGLLTFAKRYI